MNLGFETYLWLWSVLLITPLAMAQRSFTIDYESNSFLKDGQPFRYFAGSIHYPRLPEQYWEDRLLKMKAAGLNAIQTYVPWNLHEPTPGFYYFEKNANLIKFIDLASRLDLLVILRVGPYICAEWDNGGLPWWLLNMPGIELRKTNQPYISAVQRWFHVLLTMIGPQLYNNGGPIISIQVENEYGSYPACDTLYMATLRDIIKSYVEDTVLFTTDGPSTRMLNCGTVEGVFPTVDFGPNNWTTVWGYFNVLRQYAPKGPLVNSEFYPGWLDTWGSPWAVVDTQPILDTMRHMHMVNASFAFYMFFGGSNFDYLAGAFNQPYASVTTSYDYDAPLSEAGDPTPKYYAIRQVLTEFTGHSLPEVPPALPKKAYGAVTLLNLGPIIDLLDFASPPNLQQNQQHPFSFEELNFPYGYILYETTVGFTGMEIEAQVKDRAHVIQDRQLVGYLSATKTSLSLLPVQIGKLQLLVENRGRSCHTKIDKKGIIGEVTIDGRPIVNWQMYPIALDPFFEENLHIPGVLYRPRDAAESQEVQYGRLRRLKNRLEGISNVYINYLPSLFWGTFAAAELEDTFFDPVGWGKGQLFINGYNLGRYWPTMGPQVTLYVPKTVLKAVNVVVLFELDSPGHCIDSYHCQITFTNVPFLNKPVA